MVLRGIVALSAAAVLVVPLTSPLIAARPVATAAAPGPAQAVAGADRAATSAPAVVPRAAGGYDVFYRGWNGAVFERTLVNGAWSAAGSLGGLIVGAPAAAAVGGDVVLVTRGVRNALDIRIRRAGRWSVPRSLGLTVTAAGAVAGSAGGRVDVVARGQDERLYTRTLRGTVPTTPWRALTAGPAGSAPAVAATAPGRLTVLVAGAGHEVLRRTLGAGGWSAWTSIGGRTFDSPAVAAVPGTGRVLAVVRGTDHRLYSRELPGGVWRPRAGALIDAPAAGPGGHATDLVVVRGETDQFVSRIVRAGVWSPYRPAWRPTAVPAPRRDLLGTDWTHLPTGRRVIALTFDAGANADGYRSIRTTLQRRNVRATFFLTGAWVHTFPALAADLAQNGFVIGNHSATHPHFPALTDARVARQVRGAAAAILRSTGTEVRPLFRFPFGDVDGRVLRDVNRLGYVAVRWTIDTLGWEGTSGGMTVQKVVDRVLAGARNGAIVLMHTGSNPKDHTTLDAHALPTIITRLRERGFTFVTLAGFAG